MYVGVFKSILLALIGLAVVGCFKNPGEEAAPVSPSSIPISPVYKTATDSYLLADGSCKGNSSIVVTYSSALTPSKTVEGMCIKDKASFQLPVLAGDVWQTFSVQMWAKLKGKKSKPISLIVNYSPVPPSLPGFAVLSGGQYAVGGGYSVTSAIGQPHDFAGPNLPNGAGVTLHPGIKGVMGQ